MKESPTKDYVLKVRLTALERATLEQHADEAGKTISQVVRDALWSYYLRNLQPAPTNESERA